jgi:transcriptional regulatory protein RtcR
MASIRKPTVVISLLGTTLDEGKGARRWERWRPTVSLCQHEDFLVDRLELIQPASADGLAGRIERDIKSVSPETEVVRHVLDMKDPWDFEEVYSCLHQFATDYTFDTAREDYLVHITTGTHVAQICNFLLTETRYFPAKLIQTSPSRTPADAIGTFSLIDLDLSRYDRLASRFEKEHSDAIVSLKGGIETQSPSFNRLIEEVEHVAARTTDPMLITGPTGAGKSRLASRIYELRKHRHLVEGDLVEINCATLRGDGAMSTLFGHKKGAFTGAMSDRPGLLRAADNGMLFLDEIGELGLDEQAMLLRAIEERRFLPMGSDKEVSSDFQLLAGTNQNLSERVRQGAFREDLMARINLWSFELPSLRQRKEDIEPNLDYELERFAQSRGYLVRFSAEARSRFLRFAQRPDAEWTGNFRDLVAAITRMATLAPGGRITTEIVDDEVGRLMRNWGSRHSQDFMRRLAELMGPESVEPIDLFDLAQLETVIQVCCESKSLSEAGRTLFAASREKRKSQNDSDRIRKYLAKYGLSWDLVQNLALQPSSV